MTLLLALGAGALPVASQSTAPYRVIDLGVVPGQSPNAGVGAAVLAPDGSRAAGTSVWIPYVWEPATGMRALPKLAGFLNAEVHDLASDGRALGSCGYVATGNNALTAAVWDAQGRPTSLGKLSGPFSVAKAFGANGSLFGNVTVRSGSSYIWHAFVWTPTGGMVDLTPTARAASVLDSNEQGVVSMNIDGAGFLRQPNGALTNIGEPALRLGEDGRAAGLNGGKLRLWSPASGWRTATGPDPVDWTHVAARNRLGQVVGTQSVRYQSSPPRYYRYGHLFSEGAGFQKLDDLVDRNRAIRVTYTSGIADDGRILAEGSIGPDNRAFLLVPQWFTHGGSGCPTSRGVPLVGAAGLAKPGGSFTLLASAGAGAGSGAFLVAARSGSTTVGACTLHVDLGSAIVVPVTFDADGLASRTVPVPASVPAGSVFTQVVALDAVAPNGLFGLSGGLRIDVR